jgi:hypothetical protein
MTKRQFLRILWHRHEASASPRRCAQLIRTLPGTQTTHADAGATGAASSPFRGFVAGIRVGGTQGQISTARSVFGESWNTSPPLTITLPEDRSQSDVKCCSDQHGHDASRNSRAIVPGTYCEGGPDR